MVLAVPGLRGARARSQGLLCMGSGARLAGPGARTARLRAVPEEGQRPKNLAQPLSAGLVTNLRFATRRRASLGRGRVDTAPVDRWSQRPPCKSRAISGCSPTLFQVAVAPGGHAARASARRCPPLDARATAPSGGLFSEVKAHSLLPLQGCPRRGLSSKLEAHALTSRRHTLPRGLLPPWWRPPRSSTSGTGSRPTSIY